MFTRKFEQIKSDIKSNQGLWFIIRFMLALGVGFLIAHSIPLSWKTGIINFTAGGSILLAKMIGLSALHAGREAYIVIEGFELAIVYRCSAINYIVIFIAAMVAYPRARAWRAYGLFTGLTFLLLLNFLRITLLGWYGANYPESFSFVHEFVWEYVFLIMVISIWVLWANGGVAGIAKKGFLNRSGSTRAASNLFGAAVWYRAVCLLCFTVIAVFSFDWVSARYMALLAGFSESFMHVIGYEQVTIVSKGKFLELLYPENNVSRYISTATVYNFLFFIALTICFSKVRTKVQPLMRFMLGMALLVFIHLIALMATCLEVVNAAADTRVLYVLRYICTISPFVIWGLLNYGDMVKNKIQLKKESTEVDRREFA